MGLQGKTGVDEMGLLRKFVDEMGVDQMGVDQMGCYQGNVGHGHQYLQPKNRLLTFRSLKFSFNHVYFH